MRLLSSMGRRTRERTAVSCEGARVRSHGAKIVQCSSRLETKAKLGSNRDNTPFSDQRG